jgi:hypothetical protein
MDSAGLRLTFVGMGGAVENIDHAGVQPGPAGSDAARQTHFFVASYTDRGGSSTGS